MVEKVHGTSFPGQALTGSLNFYAVRSLMDIRPSAGKNPSDASQKRLDKLIETISLRAQPVIIGEVTVTTELRSSTVDLPGRTDQVAYPGTATEVPVYTMVFAIEKNMAWEVMGVANPTLAETLSSVEGFIYEWPQNSNNVSISPMESLLKNITP
jgi:hypothetical protein